VNDHAAAPGPHPWPPGARPPGRWSGDVALVLASSTGGIGRHVASLAAGLVTAQATVTVYGPAATDERFGFSARAGADFVPLEIPANLHPRDARAVTALRRAWAGRRPDVVHAHGLRAGLVAAAARSARPLVVTWHNALLAAGLRGRAYRFAERYLARSADVTLGASTDLVARAVAAGARDARLGEVAAPPLPAPRRTGAAVRAELGVDPDTPLLLSVGRLHPQKGYGTLIEAAARWRSRRPAPAVVIAGTGPSYLDLVAHISAARAPVTLLGHRDDVADLLAAADIALVTSVWEARQLFAQEVLCSGTPLVATAVGGIPDLVGEAALLVPPGDVDALDAAVRRLLDDPRLAREYGERGRARSRLWPTEQDTVAQVLALYAELTGRPATAAGPH
jgi:glycosyltransferase involved in cell wall biosynthesis